MAKVVIERPSDFEFTARKLVQVATLNPKKQKAVLALMLKSFQAGFALGLNKKTEVEV